MDSLGVLTIDNSTLSHNSATHNGGGIFNVLDAISTISHSSLLYNNAPDGGGIENWGMLTIDSSTLSGNSASDRGAGINNGPPGGLTIDNSTLSGNIGLHVLSKGGGIRNDGLTNINNSTLSGNLSGEGGGVYNDGKMNAANITVSNNTATTGAGIYHNTYGDYNLELKNSIITNSVGGDCFNNGGALIGINNLVDSDANCPTIDRIGAVSNFDTNLGDNGGPTLTHALLAGSNAIDASASPICQDTNSQAFTTDQRGLSRPIDGDGDGVAACDLGAVERQ